MYFLSLQVRLIILCAFQFDLLITSIYEESSWYKAHKDIKILPQIVTRLLLGREKLIAHTQNRGDKVGATESRAVRTG